MQTLEQTLDSREVATMVEKDHAMLLRDLRRYTKQFTECKIAVSDFFRKSEYKDSTGRTLPCYSITLKGCEFIAHKLTGTKGTIFTARYINRFHEMQDILSKQKSEPELPWFIRRFRGKYIMLFRDFETVTGISLHHSQPFWKAHCDVMNSRCSVYWNGWGWHTTIDKEKFLKEYGFEYGDEECMFYLYPCGIRKALQLCREDKRLKLEQSAYDMISDSLKAVAKIEKPAKAEIQTAKKESVSMQPLVQIQVFGNSDYVISTKHNKML